MCARCYRCASDGARAIDAAVGELVKAAYHPINSISGD
jgi:hypothetical protein